MRLRASPNVGLVHHEGHEPLEGHEETTPRHSRSGLPLIGVSTRFTASASTVSSCNEMLGLVRDRAIFRTVCVVAAAACLAGFQAKVPQLNVSTVKDHLGEVATVCGHVIGYSCSVAESMRRGRSMRTGVISATRSICLRPRCRAEASQRARDCSDGATGYQQPSRPARTAAFRARHSSTV